MVMLVLLLSLLLHCYIQPFTARRDNILEAMALGRAVICLDLGGPAVRVTNETGIKIPARHPRQVELDLAEAMRRLASDRDLLRHLGRAGRQWSTRTHGPEEVGLQLDGIYRDAILGWSPGRRYVDAAPVRQRPSVRGPQA